MPIRTTDFDQQFVELSHGKTRYLTAGTGPPLLLLHGVTYTGGGDVWLLNIGPLSEHFRVIAPDFLGWGLGDRLTTDYSFAYLVDFVRELQDALGIEKSHVVGHSMGGWISSVFAYESPNRVDKLVLVGSGGTRTRTIPEMTEFQPPDRAAILAQWRKHYGEAADIDFEQMTDEAEAKTRVPGGLEVYRKILRHMNTPENRSRYNTLRRLSHVKLPTMIVWGQHDATNNVEMAYATKEVMPHARLEILDTDHMVPMQKPLEFNRLLIDFLTD